MRNIKIEQISSKNFGEITSFIKEYHFKPYYYLKQLKEEYKIKLFRALLFNAISRTDNFLFTAKNKNKYVGFILLERQEWDSSFFGFNCYRIEHLFAIGARKEQIAIKKILLDYILRIAQKNRIKYISAKVDACDFSSMLAFHERGFIQLCTMLHFNYYSQKSRKHFKQFGRVREFKPSDLKSLQAIARNSMAYDHFHSDPHFSKERCDTLYATLIANCCKGVNADKVFVVERKSGIVGYVACKIRKELSDILPLSLGNIRHLAVLQPEGFGCGPGLQETALNWFKERADCVESATTVQNLPIIRISIHSGMEIVSSYARFSKWLSI